ncbi:mammalian cell entry protein [Mycobacterium sp.]|uniref:mammalian cell entry protein n=1 Tax=Mycobacterium sp. TaxID=1785 RepID=UPI0031DDA266
MENQQPATGGVSERIADGQSADTASDEAGPTEAEVGQQLTSDEDTSADEARTEAEDDPPAVRRPRRGLAIVVGTAIALFVGSAAFASAFVWPYLVDRATVSTKMQIARTAASAITTLWTYNPDNVDKLADRATQYLSGDFGADYRKYIDKITAPSKQAQITNSTLVIDAAVESLDGPNADAIVYTNTTSTSPLTKNIPSLKYFSFRLTMKREHARWLVTKMTTITSLDLTPKF